MANKSKEHMGQGKRERFLQPSILMGLRVKSSYGYELIHTVKQFGFIEGQAPPGMVYRHLRQLEEDGFVSSEWKTQEAGPAKRMYSLTPEGEEMLALWIEYMEDQDKKLRNFIEFFRRSEKQSSR
jgi:PadR family transcriptional regulator, regulatory protein PadR